MNWYYASAGQPVGPISQEEFDNLVRVGTIKPDTLVWREGMPNWEPFSKVGSSDESSAAAPVGTPSTAADAPGTCGECGQTFGENELVRYGTVAVCAGCRPGYLQRLRAGIVSPAGGPSTSQADLIERDYRVPIGEYAGRSWDLFKSDPGNMILVTLVIGLILIAVNAIPYLSIILSLLFTGPIVGGFWWFFLRRVRGETATAGDMLGGLGFRFWQMVLAHLVPGMLSGICIFVVALMAALILPLFVPIGRAEMQVTDGIPPSLVAIMGFLFFVGFVGFVYLHICWLFTVPLVRDKGLDFWPAMQLSWRVVRKHWWGTFGLAAVCAIIGLIGFFACGVGLLIAAPIAMGMLAFHYENVFGDLSPEAV